MNYKLELVANNNIKGKDFVDFLDICFKYSTYFSLTKNERLEDSMLQEHDKFLEQLSEFHIRTIETTEWFYNGRLPGQEMKIFLFRADTNAKIILLNHFDNLFLQERNGNESEVVKNLPEDLCFFIKNKVFVGTVSHESICSVYPPSEKLRDEFLTQGYWRLSDCTTEEQTVLERIGEDKSRQYSLKLRTNLEGNDFYDFLDFCFKHSTHFSFMKNKYVKDMMLQEHDKFLEQLSKFYIKTIEKTHWTFKCVVSSEHEKLLLFRSDQDAKEIIRTHFDNLFLRERKENKLGDVKNLPVDLCFFIDNKLFVGTVSDLSECIVISPTAKLENEVLSKGYWNLHGKGSVDIVLK